MSDKEWDDLVDPARVALEALITSGDNIADRIKELEAREQRIREEVLKEAAAAIAKDGSRNTVYQKSRNDAVKIILALIEKNKTNHQ